MIIAGIIVIAISWIPGMLGEAFKSIYPESTNPETLMLTFAQGYFPPLLAAIFLTAMATMGMSTVGMLCSDFRDCDKEYLFRFY